jgi:isopenicillin N synthase-like dioxygenase
VKYVYRAYWGIIKNKIETLPLKDDLTEEDFKQLKTFFNLPQLGKLTCTY